MATVTFYDHREDNQRYCYKCTLVIIYYYYLGRVEYRAKTGLSAHHFRTAGENIQNPRGFQYVVRSLHTNFDILDFYNNS